MAEVDLAQIAERLERLSREVASLKNGTGAVLARLSRLDAKVQSAIAELRAVRTLYERLGAEQTAA